MAILPVGHVLLNRTVTITMESLRLLLVARPPYLSYLKVPLGWQPAWYFRLREVKPALSVPCRGLIPDSKYLGRLLFQIYYPTQVVT
jgi:hypothetical protein